MKKKSTHPKVGNEWLQLSSLTAAMLLISIPAHSQDKVVIEGGPGEIQISDRDGKPEAVNPANNKIGEPIAVLPPTTDADGVAIKPLPNSNVKVLVPVTKRNSAGKTVTDVKTAPVTTPAPTQISPEKSKRIAEIKRELGIAETAIAARVIFKAEDLFSKKSPVLEDTAKPSLKMFAEFMELSPKEKATVSYKYIPTAESENEARLRTLTLVNHLSSVNATNASEFTMMDPEPILEENPQTAAPGETIATPESLIEITLK